MFNLLGGETDIEHLICPIPSRSTVLPFLKRHQFAITSSDMHPGSLIAFPYCSAPTSVNQKKKKKKKNRKQTKNKPTIKTSKEGKDSGR